MDYYSDVSEPEKPLAIRAYGVSGSTLKKEIERTTNGSVMLLEGSIG